MLRQRSGNTGTNRCLHLWYSYRQYQRGRATQRIRRQFSLEKPGPLRHDRYDVTSFRRPSRPPCLPDIASRPSTPPRYPAAVAGRLRKPPAQAGGSVGAIPGLAAGLSVKPAKPLGTAHALSPDVYSGHPRPPFTARPLHFALQASLASVARSRARAAPRSPKPPRDRMSPMSTSGRLKTLAFQLSAPREKQTECRRFP